MRFRRPRAAEPTPDDAVAETVEPDAEDQDDTSTEDADHDETADDDEAADAVEETSDDADGEDEDEPDADEFEDPEPTGRFAWLRPRKKRIDYGPDFTVRVATLPDLERFPEDGHVHPEIVRSWMALQQFGEAMLLVSWVDRAPAGYVLVSWTGDWDDEVRAAHPNVPALCNLWTDEQYADEGIERRLVEAALAVCGKQGKAQLLATIEADNSALRTELDELGFADTGMTTSEKYVYRDETGKKRRGVHENVVLLKDLDGS